MSSNTNSNCCKNNESNDKKKTTNVVPRVSKLKENIVKEKKSCGCIRTVSTETKPISTSCKPRRNSIITQCSVTRNQTKATVSAIDNKTKVATRPPLADIKEKSVNVQSCSTVKNCNGTIKKVTDPKPGNNLNNKRSAAAPLGSSTIKKNQTRNSTGGVKPSTQINSTSKVPLSKARATSTGVLPSTKLNSKASIQKTQSTSNLTTNPKRSSLPSTSTSAVAASEKASAKPRKCCCAAQKPLTVKLPPIQKSLIPIVEQEPLKIPSKNELEITVNTNRGFDCGSPILNASFHTPNDSTAWLTFKTNRSEQSSQLPFKEEANINKIKNDDSAFNLDNAPTNIIFDGIPSLKKKTLKKQLSVSSGYKGIVNLDPYTNKVPPAVLYSDYIIDVIKYIISKEEKISLQKDFMKQTKILPIYRTAIINWLVKLHQFVNSDANVFFLCVRLFDNLLTKIEIPQETLQLTAMITYWIANKYEDSIENLTIRKLQEISHNRYSAKYIIDYEKKILNILKYNISFEDPIVFVRYYIYILQIEDSNNVSFCANYLLECLATSWDINTFPLSLQASGAVFLSLQLLEHNLIDWNKIEFYPGYYTVDDMYIITERILERLLLIQNENYEFREIYQKYASEKYNYTSLKIFEGIKNKIKV